jgi:23S rRNA (adenine2503-C2)-methyltransferase
MELLGLDRNELAHFCVRLKQPRFRATQLARWIYVKGLRDFDSMTDIPTEMRERLITAATITRARIKRKIASPDGTSKFLLELADGEAIESVMLPYTDRLSVCVSTQVGCPGGCAFCATADCGFVRNLTPGEIVDQVLTLQEQAGRRVSHVVFMGMGEPLLNLDNTLKALNLLNNEVGIGMRKITVSTVGITPAIGKLKDMDLQITLAVSLHAALDDIRTRLMPLAAKFPLQELIEVCRDYANHTKRRITFEYLLLDGINDSPQDAQALSLLLQGMLCHVNLIPYNQVMGKAFRRPSNAAIARFRSELQRGGIEITQRLERGHAISAACGQLRRDKPKGR